MCARSNKSNEYLTTTLIRTTESLHRLMPKLILVETKIIPTGGRIAPSLVCLDLMEHHFALNWKLKP